MQNEHSGLVSGRTYHDTRPRGNAPWNPEPETLALIERVREIYEEYGFALTVRQYFYRLIGKYRYEKTERSYKRLVEYLVRGRRGGLVPWGAVRDDDDIVPPLPGWAGPDEFFDYVHSLTDDYFCRPTASVYVELWVEAAGMVPQIATVADPFGVRVLAGGGFSSVTARRHAALRLTEIEETRPTRVVLIGDFDPSGQAIMDVAAADIGAFGSTAMFQHLAVTEAQAREYDLPSAPQKEYDKRGEHMAETWQAEALDPNVLSEIVRTALQDLIGGDAVASAERRTQRERAQILRTLRRIRS